MRILADQNMPLVEEFFSEFGEITRFAGRELSPQQLVDTDILLVRSITNVNENLLTHANKLKFVGTATIGTDHVDQALLTQKGIAFSSAPGCNATAVAEYVISSLLALAQEDGFSLQDKTVGIIGVGNIGSRLSKKLAALGCNVLLCDPPKQASGELEDGVSLDTIISDADILSFHVPLVKEGQYQTKHLLNKHNLPKLKSNAIVVNSCRGDVIDNQALLEFMQVGAGLSLVLDVWENEPNIERALLPYTRIGSVHIAGHSLEGKAGGTDMLYQAVCQQLGKPATHKMADFLPDPELTEVSLGNTFTEANLCQLVHSVYDARRDYGLLKKGLNREGFDSLRKNYPGRREFSTLTVKCSSSANAKRLSQLGFNVIEE
ncbi:4-phosphoerythronate dehydrogenase PdxB [Pseudoalteromonas sp. G4]|uniref:4-phosphoerythronate dehydrogenase PdxB n=1 Tax=Pseudoalteromonas sp. G4 TaxID=2992761 RepID=UPI00237D676B|nr:4-phosphoerythronate dehydrogenase PdxB [Pseudoalteromonas sp. G4]MDE3272049.1 4-phosphoerythronate dehydrogenase PdxB [Pseudoalteromonas sp. G4]